MPSSRFTGSVTTPTVALSIDTGSPLLDHTLDGFLKIAGVAATRSLGEDAYHAARKGPQLPLHIFWQLKKMCKEGTVAGVYVGMEYGVERVRGRRDWKNAMLGGMATGALMSAATNKGTDKVVTDAITGGAIATAAKFLNYLV
ncbi:unnamed protein product [Linum tenue]|uniref:Uncharacterized protein n=1 Tax=Linum tenue TaxID=586396 RepID=A0AAV0Q5X1_9ROSI|nr:unnamed protein product [Linum tenue]